MDINVDRKKTCKRELLEEMKKVILWAALVAVIAPHYPEGRTDAQPFSPQTMLGIHFIQQ
jgi:IS5 family transposase